MTISPRWGSGLLRLPPSVPDLGSDAAAIAALNAQFGTSRTIGDVALAFTGGDPKFYAWNGSSFEAFTATAATDAEAVRDIIGSTLIGSSSAQVLPNDPGDVVQIRSGQVAAPGPLIRSADFAARADGTYEFFEAQADWTPSTISNSTNLAATQTGTILFSGGKKELSVNPRAGETFSGGLNFRASLENRDEYFLEYTVRFSVGFEWVQGGKLPGLGGGTSPTGGVADPNGFSSRYMWQPGGGAILYLYWNEQVGPYGNGFQLGTFIPGTNHRLRQRIVLNTPGVRNGIVEVWFDGVLALSRHDMLFRVAGASWSINQVVWHCYYGGNDDTFEPSLSTNFMVFDEFNVWTGVSGGSAGTPATSVVAETSYALASAVGTSTNYARQDHTHGTPALPSPAAIGAATPADITAHEADTTSVHGIADTSTLYRAGGTDVAVADGGTGSSTAAGARTNLGLVIGTDVAAVSHTQTASTITDFAEAVDDRVAALLIAGSNVTLTYNDAANTLTVDSTGGGGGPSPSSSIVAEQSYGQIGAVGTSATYARGDHSHGTPALTSATPAALGTAAVGVATLPARADHVHTMPTAVQVGADASGTASTLVTNHEAAADPHPGYQLESTINETIDDRVAALLVAGANVTLTYNDVANTLTVGATGGGGGNSVSDLVTSFLRFA